MKKDLLFIACVLLLSAPGFSQDKTAESLPPGAKLSKIEVRPAAIELKSPYDYRQLLLTGVLESGEKVDITRMVELKAPDSLVKISSRGQVRPVADGAGELNFSIAGQSGAIPIKISGQKEKHAVSFVKDVMPVLSRIGC